MMALVTVSTIYQTINIAVLLLISKGWTILRVSLDRQEAMNVMMIMGAVYLSYSTYYVSFGMERIKTLIGASINLLYIVIFGIVMKNSHNVVSVLQQH